MKSQLLLISLCIVSFIMFGNLLINGFSLFGEWIHFVFYGLALFAPINMVIYWHNHKTKKNLFKVLVAILPGTLFVIWFTILIIEFGNILESF